jgi:hypothetical protein
MIFGIGLLIEVYELRSFSHIGALFDRDSAGFMTLNEFHARIDGFLSSP